MRDWVANLAALTAARTPLVLVTVTSTRGSAPREAGTRMIVTEVESVGTIGGGQLEYQCVQIACANLRGELSGAGYPTTRKFVLGSNCGQCCGGVVEVLFEQLEASNIDWLDCLRERYRNHEYAILVSNVDGTPDKTVITATEGYFFGDGHRLPDDIAAAARRMLSDSSGARRVSDYLLTPVGRSAFRIALFGAGHVGTAIVDMLSRLDCEIRWLDSRPNIFPVSLPNNVDAIEYADAAGEIDSMQSGTFYLVMTHSHSLDQEICQHILARGDFSYCGLIGSISKRRRFEKRMRQLGLSTSALDLLTCPIGVSGIDGKKPAEIAVSVAAEVLQVRDAILKSKAISDSPVYVREVSA